MLFKELLQTSTPAGIKGRRRRGRNNQVSPHLIPLLRSPAAVDIPAPLPGKADALPSKANSPPLKSNILSLALGVPSWVWVAGIVWAVLRWTY